jgi:hypothetical protein
VRLGNRSAIEVALFAVGGFVLLVIVMEVLRLIVEQ